MLTLWIFFRRNKRSKRNLLENDHPFDNCTWRLHIVSRFDRVLVDGLRSSAISQERFRSLQRLHQSQRSNRLIEWPLPGKFSQWQLPVFVESEIIARRRNCFAGRLLQQGRICNFDTAHLILSLRVALNLIDKIKSKSFAHQTKFTRNNSIRRAMKLLRIEFSRIWIGLNHQCGCGCLRFSCKFIQSATSH